MGKSFQRWFIAALLPLLFLGCGAQTVLETVQDEHLVSVMAQPGKIRVELPEDAEIAAMESDTGRLFLGSDYEIAIETLEGGSLDSTLRSLTGRGENELTLVETQTGNCRRYDFVWAGQTEAGEQLGRGVILDDGSYHYCLSVLRPSSPEMESQVVWSRVFQSFSLGE